MVPFRVYDRDNKITWTVINYHANPSGGGKYLAAKEDDTNNDRILSELSIKELLKCRLVDFLDEPE